MSRRIVSLFLATGSLLAQADAQARPAHEALSPPASLDAPAIADLARRFADPPVEARPRVWWHWMNGNITKDGIAKDLAWMKSVGIGGAQTFDVNLTTPRIVDKRLVYMSPEWKDAFRFAAAEADRLGLELAIASSPGWSETGGPWVTPQDALKKLVWSETIVEGGKPFAGRLATPPSITGPFQAIPQQPDLTDLLAERPLHPRPERLYRDTVVLAVPVADVEALPVPDVFGPQGERVEPGAINGGPAASGLRVAAPGTVTLDYRAPVALRCATVFLPGAAVPLLGGLFAASLEASDDNVTWKPVADVPLATVPTTVSFRQIRARYMRLSLRFPTHNGGEGGSGPGPAADNGLAMPDPFGAMIGKIMSSPLTVTQFTASSAPMIDRFETKAGFALAGDYLSLPVPQDNPQVPAPASVIDLTGKLRPDGGLDWTPPPGRWKVLRMGYSLLGTTNHPATAEATGLEADVYDAGAVRRYMDHYLGMYRDAAGPELVGAHGVRALVTDSIEVGAANWTPNLIRQFRRLRGYDPLPWLPTLTGQIVQSRAASDSFLLDYRRTLSELMASEHYGTIAQASHEAGLKFYAEALESRRPSLGDDMAMRRYADYPMAATWAFARGGQPEDSARADIRGAASIAHILGREDVAAESFTASMKPWAFGPADLKHVVDFEFVSGVTRPVIHTSVHVPGDDHVPGLSLGGIGQYFNRNESWAPLARPWIDYIARNSVLLRQGRNVADLAYFYGEEAPLTGLYSDRRVPDAPREHAYDFLDIASLSDALANDGGDLVTPGGARYRAIYLGGSSDHMSLATLRRLSALVEGGATLIGQRPVHMLGLAGDKAGFDALADRMWSGRPETMLGKGRVIASNDADAALERAGVAPAFHMAGAGADAEVPFIERQFPGGRSWFLVNRRETPVAFEGHFRVTGLRPEIWHAETGAREAVTYRIVGHETVVPLHLAAGDALHIVFAGPAQGKGYTVPAAIPAPSTVLEGAWTVRFQPGRGAPQSAVLPRLAPLDTQSEPGIRYFSGIATYQKDFAAPRGWKVGQPLMLDLGEARDIAEVTVNGKVLGSVWHAPYRLDIGDAVRPGRNRLSVRVANLWVNRLIGDQQPGAQKITWTDTPTYKASASLRRSGLVGLVTLTPMTSGESDIKRTMR